MLAVAVLTVFPSNSFQAYFIMFDYFISLFMTLICYIIPVRSGLQNGMREHTSAREK